MTSEPLVLMPGEGRRIPPTITVKTDKDVSSVALFESEPPAGVVVAPPHLHHDYTESFYVLTGEIEFRAGGRDVRLAPGAFVHVPPGIVHGFHNPGPGPAKMLIMVYPAAGLGVVEDVYALIAASAGAPEPAAVRAVYAKHNTELISS